MTRYWMLVADELIASLTAPDAPLPAHMTVIRVGASIDGRRWVTVEDTRAPSELDGHVLDPVFTRHQSGELTVDYGQPVDPCER